MHNNYIEDTNEAIEIVGNQQIEETERYIYIGQHISFPSSSKEEKIKRRITCFERQSLDIANNILDPPRMHKKH